MENMLILETSYSFGKKSATSGWFIGGTLPSVFSVCFLRQRKPSLNVIGKNARTLCHAPPTHCKIIS